MAHNDTLTRATALRQIQGFVHRETEELKTPPIALEVPPSPPHPILDVNSQFGPLSIAAVERSIAGQTGVATHPHSQRQGPPHDPDQ